MFEYPLSLPTMSDYALLGVGPEATPQEISEAKSDLSNSLNAGRKEILKRLDRVYTAVPDLREAYEKVDALRQAGDDRAEELRAAQRALNALEAQACKVAPDYRNLRERLDELDRELHTLNRLGLQNPEERLAYDRRNPPFALLKLADCTRDGFLYSRKTLLALLRQELSAFLAGQGEPVLHPSDVSRQDFTADFAFHPMLDSEES